MASISVGKESRFKLMKILSDTLQGRIYLALDQTGEKEWVAVKETWRYLVSQGKSKKGHKVFEDFEKEKDIMWELTNQLDQNEGYVRCVAEWETPDCYYLVMEYCEGGELWDYISKNHSKEVASILESVTNNRELECQKTPNTWSLNVQSIFRQLVDTVSWMHSKGIAHLDLSLENTMLASVNEPNIKIIDFGLAYHFEPNQKFNQRVGKLNYMAPEVYEGKEYLPEKADIWCLGVMLFMMLIGSPPFKCASRTDATFRFIIRGQLGDLLKEWRVLPLVSAEALDVMMKIFKPEDDRITMEQLRNHPYVGLGNSTRNVESTSPVETANSGDKETREETDKAKETVSPVASSSDESTLTIENQLIPDVETEKAIHLSKQLRTAKGAQKMRTLMKTIEQAIDHSKKKLSLSSIESNERPEGVIDESHNYNKCVNELQKLLQVVAKTLESIKAQPNKT